MKTILLQDAAALIPDGAIVMIGELIAARRQPLVSVEPGATARAALATHRGGRKALRVGHHRDHRPACLGDAVRAAIESARLDRSQDVPAARAHDHRNPLSE